MFKSLSLVTALLSFAVAQAAPQPTAKLRLWDGPAPGAPANPPPELTIMTAAGERVTQVSTPTLDVYLPEPGKADGRALIIFGGGGYVRLAPGLSGPANAARFLPEGITVFFLKYRLTPPSTDILRDALADAKRAVRLVRSRATGWHLDPARIGVVGFSAGANLTLNLACNFDAGDPASPDPIERFSCRPDFIGLCCPWPYNQKIAQFKITGTVPPAFLAHARDDKTAPFAFAEQIAAAWKQNVPKKGSGRFLSFFDSFPRIQGVGFPHTSLAADCPNTLQNRARGRPLPSGPAWDGANLMQAKLGQIRSGQARCNRL